MNKHQEKTKKLLSTLAYNMIDRDTYEWPPKCSLFTYQPVRPCNKSANKDVAVSANTTK